MSLGKLPALKNLVSGAHPKRRQRADLTLDMIGPPLGDFRHTMHVGRGGEAFGDTSFLSEHGGAATTPEKVNFFTRTMRHVRRSPLRSRGGSIKSEAPTTHPPPPVSPIIKNAVSLPQLNEIANGGATERFTYKSVPINLASETMYPYGLESGFCTIPRLSRQERTPEPSYPPEEPESDTDSEPGNDTEPVNEGGDSLQSFHLDFGPSLMSEVLEGIGYSPTIAEEDEEEDRWDYSRGANQSSVLRNGHGAQLQGTHEGRRTEGVVTNKAYSEHTTPTQDMGIIRVNGLSCLETPSAALAGPLGHSKRDTDSITKPTPSPRGQRALWEQERRRQATEQGPAWPATTDYKAEATPHVQPQPAPEAGMKSGEVRRVARVLAHHYEEPPASREEEEDGEEADVLLDEDEEAETGPLALEGGRVYVALQGGSFAYAEEEEEDDEVKV